MSLAHQQYADLSSDAYKSYRIGVRKPDERDEIDVNGVAYKVLEHYDNPRTSYQGTIYQRLDTGAITVAHRGTEVDGGLGPLLKDGAITDGRMVIGRENPQATEALELTRRAIEQANREGQRTGITPEVTVTGHSLGGTLAQITAHHFGLKGETFNAYGAASLGLGIPRGGGDVLNHVMASDFVSAASPHYGEVRSYASREEVNVLQASGYENNDRFLFDARSPGKAHALMLGTHSMHNFTALDGAGQPDRSILADPFARQRANENVAMFEKFRDEQALVRDIATTVATRLTPGLTGFDRDDVLTAEPAGARGRREGTMLMETVKVPPIPDHLRDGSWQAPSHSPAQPSQQSQRSAPSDAAERMVIPPLPEYLRETGASQSGTQPGQNSPQHMIDRLSPRERDNYDQGLALAQRLGLPPEKAQNFGMALAAQLGENGSIQRTDRLIAVQGRAEDGGDRVFVSYHPHGDKEPIFNTSLDVNRGANTPMSESFSRIDQSQQQWIAQQSQNQSVDEPSRAARTA